MVSQNTDLTGRRVLVVEDESLVLMLLEDTLSDVGCEVVATASRSSEALEKAASVPFDVAILDVNLNGSQTLDVADYLVHRNIPFVFATGYGPAALLTRFDGVPILQKPFLRSDLALALRAALSRTK